MTTQKFTERLREHLGDIKFNRPLAVLSRLNQHQNSKRDFENA